MYKYETHLHTHETSACASAPGELQAKRYKALGYDGIFVTDHFFNANCLPEIKECSDYRRKVDMFCAGFEAAQEAGDKYGIKVFFGWEYCYEGADLLTYGLGKDWLLNNPDVCDISVFEYCDRVHRDGGFIVHAHPFREANYLREIRLLPMWTDAVEAFNCGNKTQEMNDRAAWYAGQYGLPVTAGTDNHHLTAERLSGVMTEKPIMSAEDYMNAVKNRQVTLILPEEIRKDDEEK